MNALPVSEATGVSHRARLTPGLFLETRFLRPLNLTQQALAAAIGVSRRRINEIVRGHRGITADTAVRLGHYFRTGPEFWLSLQQAWEVHDASRRSRAALQVQGRFPVRPS